MCRRTADTQGGGGVVERGGVRSGGLPRSHTQLTLPRVLVGLLVFGSEVTHFGTVLTHSIAYTNQQVKGHLLSQRTNVIRSVVIESIRNQGKLVGLSKLSNRLVLGRSRAVQHRLSNSLLSAKKWG